MDSEPRPNRSTLVAVAVMTLTATVACQRIVSKLTRGRLGTADGYNVAEVPITGPIVRDRRRPSPLSGASGATADEIVDLIEEADEDDAVDALLVRINSPGGEVLPSDDIRRAAAAFDGPTVAYATDLCASGGYWIASGCDELWAHNVSLVGSIGVVGSRPNAAELAEKLGISYEQFTAGEYKDAGIPLREIEADEREYLQGIIDGYYEQFVATVSDGRGMDPDDVRETEARVYLGSDARSVGLVDELGTRDDVEDRLAELTDTDVEVQELTPKRGLAERLGLGVERVAFAAGTGVASVVTGEGGDIDVKVR